MNRLKDQLYVCRERIRLLQTALGAVVRNETEIEWTDRVQASLTAGTRRLTHRFGLISISPLIVVHTEETASVDVTSADEAVSYWQPHEVRQIPELHAYLRRVGGLEDEE